MTVSEMLAAICTLPPDLRSAEPIRAYVLTLPKVQSTELTDRQERIGRALIKSVIASEQWQRWHKSGRMPNQ